MNKSHLALVVLVMLGIQACQPPQGIDPNKPLIVAAKKRLWNQPEPYTDWQEYETRTVKHLAIEELKEDKVSKYGGWWEQKTEATGFFYTKKIGDRWWLVDPSGYLFIERGLASTRPLRTDIGEKAWKKKYESEKDWADQAATLFRAYGYPSTGAFSNMRMAKLADKRLNYSANLSFMRTYGEDIKGLERYDLKKWEFYVLEADFRQYCMDKAEAVIGFGAGDDQAEQQLTIDVNDPNLIGYFSDNELPFHLTFLDSFLTRNEDKETFEATRKWYDERKGAEAGLNEITEDDRLAFLQFLASRYFEIVTTAIRTYDKNHLYLGCRFHNTAFKKRGLALFKAIEPYADVISLNWYGTWTPADSIIQAWGKVADKPIMIGEFYTKGEDTGMSNIAGAGWVVKTQKDRGLFYQNYTLSLLESKRCVGWHWYRYQDNDPDAAAEDTSNADSNKGVVTREYEPCNDILDKMGELNKSVYSIAAHFDKKQ